MEGDRPQSSHPMQEGPSPPSLQLQHSSPMFLMGSVGLKQLCLQMLPPHMLLTLAFMATAFLSVYTATVLNTRR